MTETNITTNHDEIRSWAEERGARPTTVKGTEEGGEEVGVLRLDFEPRDDRLEAISWEEFFDKFDEDGLAFLYQERLANGQVSRFHRFVQRPN
jgi:hypothetical protein